METLTSEYLGEKIEQKCTSLSDNHRSSTSSYKFKKNIVFKPYPLSGLDPDTKVSAKDIKIFYDIDITISLSYIDGYHEKFGSSYSSESITYYFDENLTKNPCQQRSLALFDTKTKSLLVFDNLEKGKLYKLKEIKSQSISIDIHKECSRGEYICESIFDIGVILENKEISFPLDSFGNTTIREILLGVVKLKNNIKTAQEKHQQKLTQQSIVSKNYDTIFKV